MRDRLVELVEQASERCDGTSCLVCEYRNEILPRCHASFVADHLLENGVIVPPVTVGQKVWYIHGGYYNFARKEPIEIEITEINQKWCKGKLDWAFVANGTRYKFSSIGKTVFLTREEAERALK